MSPNQAPALSIVRDQNMPSRITVNGCRVAYVKVNRPEVPSNNPTGEPKFSIVLLIPQTAQEEITALYGVQWDVCQKELGQHATNAWQQMQAQDRLAIHNGVTKAGSAGFEGMFFINASAKAERPPKLFHKYLDPQTGQVQVLTVPQNVIYSGCYANVQINFWQMNNEHGKRVNAEVLAVQFAADGEAFAAGAEADTSVFSGEQAPAAPGFGAPGQQAGGMPPGGFGYAGAPQQQFGMPPGAAAGYAAPAQAPQQQFGMPPGQQQFAAPQGQQQFAAPQQQAPQQQFGMPPGAGQQQFGMPPGAPQQQAPQQQFAAPQGQQQFAAPQGQQQFGMPPGQQQFTAPQGAVAQGGFGMPPGAPQGGFPGAPVPGAQGGYPGI